MDQNRKDDFGRIVLLNGAPRAGKSAIVDVMQQTLLGVWVNLGVDVHAGILPQHVRPGIGLRPGGERPDLEALLPALHAALFDSMAAHSRQGLHVVADLGLHHDYAGLYDPLRVAALHLAHHPVLLVGITCPIEEILRRRAIPQAGREGQYLTRDAEGAIPAPVARWQAAVHDPGIYDLTVDTSVMTPGECAAAIGEALDRNPTGWTALQRAALATRARHRTPC